MLTYINCARCGERIVKRNRHHKYCLRRVCQKPCVVAAQPRIACASCGLMFTRLNSRQIRCRRPTCVARYLDEINILRNVQKQARLRAIRSARA